MIGNLEQFFGLFEEYFQGQFDQLYKGDWQDKTILDLGGYVGDSALFFLREGAKRVITYEPVEDNVEALRLNIAPFASKVEVHAEAIGDREEVCSIESCRVPGSLSFGLPGKEYSVKVSVVPIQKVLDAHSLDMVKVDIEGGEKYLLSLSPEQLRMVPYWIVETHDPELRDKILHLFEDAGFKTQERYRLNDIVDLFHFVDYA